MRNGPSPFQRDRASALSEFTSEHAMHKITFAEGWPIQPIGFVQDDLVRLRLAHGALARAKNDADSALELHPIFSTEDYSRMKPFIRELPRPNLPRFY